MVLNNIVDNIEQQHKIVQSCFQQLVIYTSHSVRTVYYTAKNEQCSGLMKTSLNNVLLPTLFNVFSNTEEVVDPELACNRV